MIKKHVTKFAQSFKRKPKEPSPAAPATQAPAFTEKKAEKGSAGLFSSFGSSFSLKDQVFLAKRLAFLMNAGVSIVESLYVLRDQARSKGHKRVLSQVSVDIANGQALSRSFAKFPQIFTEFGVHIIQVGESSGTLSQNLAYLADELTKKHALRRKVIGTLVYPAFITVATLGITTLLMVYIFPKIMPIFTSLNVHLPWSTRALIWLSFYLRDWGLVTFGGLIIVFIGFVVAHRKIARIQRWGDWLLLKLPVAGNLARSYNLANFCRTLGLLLRSGVRVSEGMLVTAETTRNVIYRDAYRDVANGIIKGEPVSKGLKRHPELFPAILSHMIFIGETTGNLSDTLTYLSELYEGEVDELTKGLSSSIEPILMVIMGLLVGLIAVSVITPIYEITQHLNPHG